MLKAAFLKIIDFVFPHKCLNCSSMTESGGGLCGKCFVAINFIEGAYCDSCGNLFDLSIHKGLICAKCIWNKPNYDKARTLFKFNALSKKVIHDFKYNDKTNYARFFAKLFLLKYGKLLDEVDIITPVPMHRFKRLYRFYNPPMLIAKEIFKALSNEQYFILGNIDNSKSIHTIYDLLIKTKLTKTQTALKQSMRYKNIKKSISVNGKYNIKGKKILLIDDVLTTGSTAGYCSKMLKAAGAKKVYFFSVART